MSEERSGGGVFSRDDLERLSALVAAAWRAGSAPDWSVPAGTLDWSCTRTADHAIDTVLAPAFNLASRKQDEYIGFEVFTMGPDARPEKLVEGLETATRVLSAVIADADPGVRAVIRRGQTAGPEDFAARGGLELILHAHDVCTGLGVQFDPPADLCGRLREHTRSWPAWGSAAVSDWQARLGWNELPKTDDPWSDLLHASGRRQDRTLRT